MTTNLKEMDLRQRYGESSQGNFRVIDKIGVPHAYCITPKHVAWASDHCSGMLTSEAIRDAEAHGAACDICREAVRRGKQQKILSVDEHEQALLVESKVESLNANEELHAYLLGIKEKCEEDGYAGFAFTRAK